MGEADAGLLEALAVLPGLLRSVRCAVSVHWRPTRVLLQQRSGMRNSEGCELRSAVPVAKILFRPEIWAVGQPRRTIVTWLILPVVICLSQRLSQACLSISNYTAKLRMAH